MFWEKKGVDILCVDEAAGYNVDLGGSSRYICTLRTPWLVHSQKESVNQNQRSNMYLIFNSGKDLFVQGQKPPKAKLAVTRHDFYWVRMNLFFFSERCQKEDEK